jgi:hypothetical protein
MTPMRLLYLVFVLFCTTSFTQNKTTVHFYKCITDKTTVYSHTPCGDNVTQHSVTHSNTKAKISPKEHYKILNDIEKKQILRNLKRQLRAKKHEIAILNRNRDKDTRKEQERLNRLMDESKKKKVIKDIKAKLKTINISHKNKSKQILKKITKLEKRIKRME